MTAAALQGTHCMLLPKCSHTPSLDMHAGGSGGPASAGEVFYSVLVEWWLTDGEEPMPVPSAAALNPAAPGLLGPSALRSGQSLR